MCGIAGRIDFAGTGDVRVVDRMCRMMRHRGPNSRGIWTDGPAALGMQRLSIIDVAGGDQPIFNEDRTVAVVMNGEIYNFEELRHRLAQAGHRFATHSDTEVLVHLYEDEGERLVESLRGMFAFAIWDVARRQLLLGRDRVGQKPLFIARDGSKFWFASEVMALLQDSEIDRSPSLEAIASYLAVQYVPHTQSAFTAISKLPPGTTLTVDARGERRRRYWQLDYDAVPPSDDRRELAERLREILWEATRIRLISEVPLGAFLSGGIDSSAIVAAMADQMTEPVKTFSIGFPHAAFDELPHARRIAELYSTDHHEFVVEPHALEIMPKLARHYGEPFADPSAVPSFYLAEMTSAHVTVALNGDGGDESFAGYTRYARNRMLARFNHAPYAIRAIPGRLMPDRAPRKVRRIAQVLGMEPAQRYVHWMSAFQTAHRATMFQADFLGSIEPGGPERFVESVWLNSRASKLVNRMLDVDINSYLPGDLLVKMDIATMAHSVEGRSPFLDHVMMEFAASLPVRWKLQRGNGKRILKAALRGIVPDDILDRPKMGFGVPLPQWFRRELRDLPGEMLLGEDARVHQYVKPAAIARMIEDHHEGTADHSLRLWVLLQLEHWHREVVESPILDSTSLPLTTSS